MAKYARTPEGKLVALPDTYQGEPFELPGEERDPLSVSTEGVERGTPIQDALQVAKDPEFHSALGGRALELGRGMLRTPAQLALLGADLLNAAGVEFKGDPVRVLTSEDVNKALSLGAKDTPSELAGEILGIPGTPAFLRAARWVGREILRGPTHASGTPFAQQGNIKNLLRKAPELEEVKVAPSPEFEPYVKESVAIGHPVFKLNDDRLFSIKYGFDLDHKEFSALTVDFDTAVRTPDGKVIDTFSLEDLSAAGVPPLSARELSVVMATIAKRTKRELDAEPEADVLFFAAGADNADVIQKKQRLYNFAAEAFVDEKVWTKVEWTDDELIRLVFGPAGKPGPSVDPAVVRRLIDLERAQSTIYVKGGASRVDEVKEAVMRKREGDFLPMAEQAIDTPTDPAVRDTLLTLFEDLYPRAGEGADRISFYKDLEDLVYSIDAGDVDAVRDFGFYYQFPDEDVAKIVRYVTKQLQD